MVPRILLKAALLARFGGAIQAASGQEPVSSFQATVPQLLENAGECDLCSTPPQWLFLVAAEEKSLSTIVEALNGVPGFSLAADSRGTMDILVDLYDGLGKIVERSESGEPGFRTRPISQLHVLCSLQALMRTMVGEIDAAETSVVGLAQVGVSSARHLDFFRQVLPCARFILHAPQSGGEATSQLLSQVQASEGGGASDADGEAAATAEAMVAWQARHPQEAVLLTSERVSSAELNQVLAWLGVEDCHFPEAAEGPHVAVANALNAAEAPVGRRRAALGACLLRGWAAAAR